MCVSALIDERPTDPVPTRRSLRCSPTFSSGNNQQLVSPSFFSPLVWVHRGQTQSRPEKGQWAASPRLTLWLCRKDCLCQIPPGHRSSILQSPGQFGFLWMGMCVCVVYNVYLCVHLCLQQLSEIISLYHVMPHVGIFAAVPERLFCFLRLASAHRNVAY